MPNLPAAVQLVPVEAQAAAQRVVLPIGPYLPKFDCGQHKERIDWNETPDRVLYTEELSKFFEWCIEELPEDTGLPETSYLP